MVTQEKLTSQILASKTWTSQEQQQTLALASTQDRSAINPSRSITLDDEIYLRDYALAAAILSWDKCTYGLPEQVTAADITNIAIAGDTVWYQIQLHRAKQSILKPFTPIDYRFSSIPVSQRQQYRRSCNRHNQAYQQ